MKTQRQIETQIETLREEVAAMRSAMMQEPQTGGDAAILVHRLGVLEAEIFVLQWVLRD